MKSVKIVEVGLRDGLQNETTMLSVDQRLVLLKKLIEAGVTHFEIGAFVSPEWVPQMSVTADLIGKYYSSSVYNKKFSASVLVPNEKGMRLAIEAGVKEVAIFASCSETFSKKNINCTIDESFERFKPVIALAKKHKIKVRGYLSTCFSCPFEGAISQKKVIAIARRMFKLGVYEVSIGDTIGAAHVGEVRTLFSKLKKAIPIKNLAGHFHDTRGQALANILAAYDLGVRTFDTSLGGLGGCPYAPGASGNVATEDVVYMFEGMKVKTGLKLDKLVELNQWLQPLMNHSLPSKVGRVGRLKPLKK
ncbi:MAG: hydroxymethylglutaryl-CoA lyase [Bdellovibrionales bacterium RIFCSPHIGHO2_01_FULL_40_29]|nr:MAG: hydroxymethylglutaryl-CoA lyase [Bdellovibrionales bacterium RIFCSPHIGHO2_01_FULL_40_29]OFZ35092.1 MAG: hydroxymethylglutaryl-CoA lyase [Bdellovibrionales bacterium RIFCSPHIGHO2_02_FULL_40_15]